ncbi:hypothetical protein Dimus_012951 [Dionaea muscipula]
MHGSLTITSFSCPIAAARHAIAQTHHGAELGDGSPTSSPSRMRRGRELGVEHDGSSASPYARPPMEFAWKRGARPLSWQFGLGQEMEAHPSFMASSRSMSVLSLVRSDRPHDPDDDDVCSEEVGLRTPPLQDLTGIPSLDEFTDPEMLYADMTKGRRLQLPSGAFARGGRGKRGAGGRGRPDSLDRARASARDPEDRDRRSFCDAQDRPPKPPSAELMRGKGVASDYPRESQKRRLPTGPIDFQDPVGERESPSLRGSPVVLALP